MTIIQKTPAQNPDQPIVPKSDHGTFSPMQPSATQYSELWGTGNQYDSQKEADCATDSESD